jgi:alanine racemase
MGYSEAEAADPIVRHGFRQVVYRLDAAKRLSGEAVRQRKLARVHVKVETGTNRQGVPADGVVEFVSSVSSLPSIEVEGLYTHFANIEDTLDPTFATRQLSAFEGAIARLEAAGARPRVIHAAATAGILLYPETHFSMVRLGIGAYGVWPSRETRLAARERGAAVELKPALTWKTRIAQLKRIEPGEFVGYGLSFQAGRPMTLAVIPTGYYEGYDRRLSNSGVALVGGKQARVIGRVAMNMTVLDVTDVENAAEDDEVVLLGEQRGLRVSADDVADKVGTISYEILSRINPKLARRPVP